MGVVQDKKSSKEPQCGNYINDHPGLPLDGGERPGLYTNRPLPRNA